VTLKVRVAGGPSGGRVIAVCAANSTPSDLVVRLQPFVAAAVKWRGVPRGVVSIALRHTSSDGDRVIWSGEFDASTSTGVLKAADTSLLHSRTMS